MTLVNATFAEASIRQNRGHLAQKEHVPDKDRTIGSAKVVKEKVKRP
jgi:hypothetical protein